jgi:hypothetical protein
MLGNRLQNLVRGERGNSSGPGCCHYSGNADFYSLLPMESRPKGVARRPRGITSGARSY